jgi:hypothetical protein
MQTPTPRPIPPITVASAPIPWISAAEAARRKALLRLVTAQPKPETERRAGDRRQG